jgi:hypothetical protein
MGEKPYGSRTLPKPSLVAHKVIHRMCAEVGAVDKHPRRHKIAQWIFFFCNQLLRVVAPGLRTILSTKDVQKMLAVSAAFPLCSGAFVFKIKYLGQCVLAC